MGKERPGVRKLRYQDNLGDNVLYRLSRITRDCIKNKITHNTSTTISINLSNIIHF
ncbi:hypothetical protein HanIR_Chr04g0163551 [Helianthus annuus]|nr:hypothetical protein HanIR_Chr04g0163551 [Helianthus annuus]